ncbi:hypothetical protein K402DRAFT_406437 [Aulographum hederae CBS 113979]|uniref:Kri1-like C-terminal domain-containing protein n=1 Tax=Aulographum hederae CBS 113979 TaxID=1176131 RepID=A0A6G1GT66_9PEZI|nr:hypothetical protein K402DRAFT_406437 [Aulographum hederae CBS 113979]
MEGTSLSPERRSALQRELSQLSPPGISAATTKFSTSSPQPPAATPTPQASSTRRKKEFKARSAASSAKLSKIAKEAAQSSDLAAVAAHPTPQTVIQPSASSFLQLQYLDKQKLDTLSRVFNYPSSDQAHRDPQSAPIEPSEATAKKTRRYRKKAKTSEPTASEPSKEPRPSTHHNQTQEQGTQTDADIGGGLKTLSIPKETAASVGSNTEEPKTESARLQSVKSQEKRKRRREKKKKKSAAMETDRDDIFEDAAIPEEKALHKAPRTTLVKKTTLFEDDDDESHKASDAAFNINRKFAARFEHNKQREEKHQLEEKYGNMAAPESSSDSESSSEDEMEFFQSTTNAEIDATLAALQSKDPRIWDQTTKFYSTNGDRSQANGTAEKKEKPVYLKDFQRQHLLSGNAGLGDDEEQLPQKSYAQEQEGLKDTIKDMHADAGASDPDADDDEFMVKKAVIEPGPVSKGATKSRPDGLLPDPTTADIDPKKFLNDYIKSNAWMESTATPYKPLDLDEEEDEDRAEEFEGAFNHRFEDPDKANATLTRFSRQGATKQSVRREETNPRKRAREAARAKKDAEKEERHAQKARLRKLKLAEMEGKVEKIREAAGLRGEDVDIIEWKDMLEAEYDDEKWDEEMKKRFDEDYYANQEEEVLGEDDENVPEGSENAPGKPSWENKIDIKDLVPDFQDETDDDAEPAFDLSDGEEAGTAPKVNGDALEQGDQVEPADVAMEDGNEDNDGSQSKPKAKKAKKKERMRAKEEAKAASRRDRRIVEAMVDNALPLDLPETNMTLTTDSSAYTSKKQPTHFPYRQTSPESFGLSPSEILAATDAQLNQFVGVKFLASFRDPGKKTIERSKLSKKKRLKLWRKEAFGGKVPEELFKARLRAAAAGADEDEDEIFAGVAEASTGNQPSAEDVGSKKSRKRKRKSNGLGASDAAVTTPTQADEEGADDAETKREKKKKKRKSKNLDESEALGVDAPVPTAMEVDSKPSEEQDAPNGPSKSEKKKKRKSKNLESGPVTNGHGPEEIDVAGIADGERKKKKRKQINPADEESFLVSTPGDIASAGAAEEITAEPTKTERVKNKKRKIAADDTLPATETVGQVETLTKDSNDGEHRKRKKNKHSDDGDAPTNLAASADLDVAGGEKAERKIKKTKEGKWKKTPL